MDKKKYKFKVGDRIYKNTPEFSYIVTSIKKDRYMVNDTPQYLMIRDQDEWQVDNTYKALEQFDNELKELLK